MKFERDAPSFSPIIITIQSKEEFEVFWRVIREAELSLLGKEGKEDERFIIKKISDWFSHNV